MDKDNNKLENFPDGEYEMKFSYVLAAGGTFEKTYTIHIDSDAPTIKSIEKVNVAGVDYIRVRYAEQNLSYYICVLMRIHSQRNDIHGMVSNTPNCISQYIES